jgi:hypothetical protein
MGKSKRRREQEAEKKKQREGSPGGKSKYAEKLARQQADPDSSATGLTATERRERGFIGW